MLSVVDAPTFYRTPTQRPDAGRPEHVQDASCRRWRVGTPGKVQAYEIWNEENLSREMGAGNVDPSNYLPLLKAGYQGVKAGDPNALALLGAPSPTGANIPGQSIDDLSYLQQLFALNGGAGEQLLRRPVGAPERLLQPARLHPGHAAVQPLGRLQQRRQLLRLHAREPVPRPDGRSRAMATRRSGSPSSATARTRRHRQGYEYCSSIDATTQANFLVQAFQMARALDYVAGMMQWNLNYQLAVPQTDEKWGFGIIRSDWSGRPAYSALAQMPKS